MFEVVAVMVEILKEQIFMPSQKCLITSSLFEFHSSQMHANSNIVYSFHKEHITDDFTT